MAATLPQPSGRACLGLPEISVRASGRASIAAAMTAARGVVIVAAVGLSFAAGRWWSPADAPMAPRVAPARTVVMKAAGSQVTVDDVRAAVRDELSRTMRGAPSGGEPDGRDEDRASEPAAPPSASLREAQSMLAAAVGRGRWTHDDARALRDVLRTLDPVENRQVTRVLYTAANAGQLVVETGGPLLAAHQGDRP
jgi:hypothetical protein